MGGLGPSERSVGPGEGEAAAVVVPVQSLELSQEDRAVTEGASLALVLSACWLEIAHLHSHHGHPPMATGISPELS